MLRVVLILAALSLMPYFYVLSLERISLSALREMQANQLSKIFRELGTAPPTVPVGLCKGELLLISPLVSNVLVSYVLKAVTANKLKLSQLLPFDLVLPEVNSNATVLLSVANTLWTGNFVEQSICDGRFKAYHTFANLPLAVVEWKVAAIEDILIGTDISDKELKGLVMDFNSTFLSLDNRCFNHTLIKQPVDNTLQHVQSKGITVFAQFIDLGRIIGIDDHTGDFILLVKSWIKDYGATAVIYYVIIISRSPSGSLDQCRFASSVNVDPLYNVD